MNPWDMIVSAYFVLPSESPHRGYGNFPWVCYGRHEPVMWMAPKNSGGCCWYCGSEDTHCVSMLYSP